MRVLIIEDEYLAAQKLQKQLKALPQGIEVAGVVESVAQGVALLQEAPAIDLIFSDIQLGDGISFEIFEQVAPTCPIVFTTSYDEYAIRAFKLNSIDYLLKPVKQADLAAAIQKFEKLNVPDASLAATAMPTPDALQALFEAMTPAQKAFKKRFLVKQGESLLTIKQTEIAYFTTHHEVVFLITQQAKKYVVDYTLEQLAQVLDPAVFYRANRQFIIHMEAIKHIHQYFNSRLKLDLQPTTTQEVIISKEKVRLFKGWLEGEGT